MSEVVNTFSMLFVDRKDEGGYTLRGLPEGKGFKSKDNYVELNAPYLFVEGIGFAASGAEFSQHKHTVSVVQRFEGSSADIQFDREN